MVKNIYFNTKVMKIRNLFLGMMSFAALAFVSCEQNEVQSASISTDKTSVSLPATGGEETIMVTSTRDWTVVVEGDNVSGITVSPTSGSASDAAVPVTVSADANEGERITAEIIFSAGSVSATVNFTQSGAVATDYTTIAEIRDMAPADVNSKTTIPDGTKIHGYVVVGKDLNNMSSLKNIYVQDETAGIQIRFVNDNEELSFGTEVEIDLGGQELSYYYEALQVNNLPNDNVSVLSTGNKIEPKTVTITDFLAHKYEGQYIALENVQVAASDLGKTFFEDTGKNYAYINMETSTGETFVIYSSKYSTYGTQTVPDGSGTLYGVAMKNYDDAQIGFAQTSDWAGLTGARFEGSDYLTIDPTSQTLANEAGSFTINIDTKENTAWKASISGVSGWTLSPESGTGPAEVTVTYTAGENVSATITFTAGELTATCEVSQAMTMETLTVAEFLAKEVGDTYYRMTATVSAIIGADNGRVFIKDDTGEALIYGIDGYADAGVEVGNKITLETKRGEFSGNPQGADARYISHEVVALPTLTHSLSSNVTMTGIDGFYGNDRATINGIADQPVFKFGTSSKVGSATFTIPAGTTKICMYAVAWADTNGNEESLKMSIDGTTIAESEALSSRGANSSPYTLLAYDNEDYYEFQVSGIDAETTVTVESVGTVASKGGRMIIWGVNAVTE